MRATRMHESDLRIDGEAAAGGSFGLDRSGARR